MFDIFIEIFVYSIKILCITNTMILNCFASNKKEMWLKELIEIWDGVSEKAWSESSQKRYSYNFKFPVSNVHSLKSMKIHIEKFHSIFLCREHRCDSSTMLYCKWFSVCVHCSVFFMLLLFAFDVVFLKKRASHPMMLKSMRIVEIEQNLCCFLETTNIQKHTKQQQKPTHKHTRKNELKEIFIYFY